MAYLSSEKKVSTSEPILIQLNEFNGDFVEITVDGYPYAQFQNVSIDEIDLSILKQWINETYYTFDFKSSAYFPCDLNFEVFKKEWNN